MKKLIPNLMAALAAAGLIALAGCDAVPVDPDAAGNAAGETVDGNESEENPAPIDLKTEPKTEKKKDKGPGDDTPPDEKE